MQERRNKTTREAEKIAMVSSIFSNALTRLRALPVTKMMEQAEEANKKRNQDAGKAKAREAAAATAAAAVAAAEAGLDAASAPTVSMATLVRGKVRPVPATCPSLLRRPSSAYFTTLNLCKRAHVKPDQHF
jgi:hypothetical protein